MHLLDNPLITSQVFFPRPAAMHTNPDAHDGTVPVDDDVVIGYRLYPHTPNAPLLLYFHGNGETAADYDTIASKYHDVGVSLLVVDYRGYGWSTGKPRISTMLPDAGKFLDALPEILAPTDVQPDVPLFLMGRSLGSAPAVYLADRSAEQFKGIIIESGFADAPSVFGRLGMLVPDNLMKNPELPLNNEWKISRVHLPLLVIHGERDNVIPVEHGQRLYDASPVENKRLLRVEGAGHNDLLLRAGDRYLAAVGDLIEQR